MRNVFESSFFLYLSDSVFCVLLFVGVLELALLLSKRLAVKIYSLSARELVVFVRMQFVWLFFTVVLFKLVLLSGNVYVYKAQLTGTGGSVQFSSIAEILGGLLCIMVLIRTITRGWSRALGR